MTVKKKKKNIEISDSKSRQNNQCLIMLFISHKCMFLYANQFHIERIRMFIFIFFYFILF